MIDNLISFETAKLAKEKGFYCTPDISYYNEKGILHNCQIYSLVWHDLNNHRGEDIIAPTQSLLQKWLREQYNIDVLPYPIQLLYNGNEIESTKLTYHYKIIVKGITKFITLNIEFNSYEEALEIGLQEALKLV